MRTGIMLNGFAQLAIKNPSFEGLDVCCLRYPELQMSLVNVVFDVVPASHCFRD